MEQKVSLFRAVEYLEALSIPAIEDVDGTVYKGKLLSFDEALPLQTKVEALQDDDLTPQQLRDILADICTAIGIPPEVVLRLPPQVAVKAVLHFFTSMFGGRNSPTSSEKTSTPGND